jgi:hypothetical protein
LTATVSTQTDAEIAMSDESARNLVYRFWRLTISQRRDIAKKLGVLEAGEMTLPEPERYGRALQRVGERGLLDKLAIEIAIMERR